MRTTDQNHQQNQPVSDPPTIGFLRRRARVEEDEQFFSSTEIIVELRQKQFDSIVHRSALIKPVPHPSRAGLANSLQRGAVRRGGRTRWSDRLVGISRRLRDVLPFGKTRGEKAQAWG